MNVTVSIPDKLAESLAAHADLSRQMLEALAIESYRQENLSLGQVAELLDLSLDETNAFLKTFSDAKELMRETPKQAEIRQELRELLQNRPSGGIIFTTIQKFSPFEAEKNFPTLSERENIIVIADEAHRTQYGLKARIDQKSGEVKYGYAHYLRASLPNASFIAFTGTPVSATDRDTRGVFGDYIDIYDMKQSQTDGATVPIYYESRLAKLNLREEELPKSVLKKWNDLR